MDRAEIFRQYIALVKEGTICCFCGEEIKGWGNNPEPMCDVEGARCCDVCDMEIVVPARIAMLYMRKDNNDE